MKRREFIALAGGAAAAWPLAARAQQPALPVIGFLNSESAELWASGLRAFHQGLSETSYVEGRNVAIEYRWAESRNDQLPALAADLVRLKVSVIATPFGTPAAQAAKAATSTIPIVFAIASDPVEVGFVASLARPGGNLTGVTTLNVEVGQKRLDLLHELVPAARLVALLVNPSNPVLTETLSRDMQAAARTLGLQVGVLHASTEQDLEALFASLREMRADALVIGADPFFSSRAERLGALTAQHAVPTIYQQREFAAGGGLISYGSSITDAYRLAGTYTGRILKGEKPSDLPVQQSTRIELFINLKTAKALGITVPQTLLVSADEVIE